LGTAETLRHDIYNVSSGRPATNREFADALEAITPGLRLDLLPGRQDGPGDDPLPRHHPARQDRLRADRRRRHRGRRLRRVARRQPPLKDRASVLAAQRPREPEAGEDAGVEKLRDRGDLFAFEG
jgi:hypothetical protein